MNMFIKSLVLILIASSTLFAKIIESKKMEDILGYVESGSLLVFDLDNTIMEAAQTLGSDQWFEHRINQYKEKGVLGEEAVRLTVQEWEAINYKGRVQLVEKETPSIIRDLKLEEDVHTLGLTARPASFMEQSLKQLSELKVNLARASVSNEVITIVQKDIATYKEGLMSVGNNNKGTILIALMEKVGLKPTNVIFVDDKVKNVTNVDNALNAASIASFAFRYGAADAKVKAFDAKLADFELEYFQQNGVVLTDEEARILMQR